MDSRPKDSGNDSLIVEFIHRLYINNLPKKSMPVKKLLPKEHKVELVTIASGEKIFGDGSLVDLKTKYGDDLIKAGEQEGIGFAVAAIREGVKWTVIRGISDYGDPLSKDDRYKDRFHYYASISAASYTYLFLKDGLNQQSEKLINTQTTNIKNELSLEVLIDDLVRRRTAFPADFNLKMLHEKSLDVPARFRSTTGDIIKWDVVSSLLSQHMRKS